VATTWVPVTPRDSDRDALAEWAEDRAQTITAIQSLARPMRDYAELIPEPTAGPLRFDDFPFQAEWYSPEVADAETVVMMKSSQIGASAHWWRWAVRRVDQFGEVGVYIFPTDTHVKDFGDERIEPGIEASEYLRSRIRPRFVRNKHLKRIGRGFLHLRGSNSKAGAQSVAAQFVVFDEYDHLDASNVPQIERRIRGARAIGLRPRVRRLGNPTIEGFGISEAFEHSDRRVWLARCELCAHEQEVTWEESVRWQSVRRGKVMRPGHDVFDDPNDVHRVWRACRYCDAELDVADGRWVAQNPTARIPGYHATQLIVPGADLPAIVVASRKRAPAEIEAFENNDLGRPYSAAEAQLDLPTLLAACERGGPQRDYYDGPNPVTMGVDVAGERALSVRVDEQLPAGDARTPNPRQALWIGEVDSFNDLVGMVERFGVAVVAIDDMPERRMAKALRAHFAAGRVILVHYTAVPGAPSLRAETGERGTVLEGVPLSVTVNRTEAIDAMMDSYRQGRNLPLADPPPRWLDQMRALKRKTELDQKGNPRRVYVTTGNSGDDYAHADVYALVATELWRMRGGMRVLAAPERPLPDEELGFKRMRLGRDSDEYVPGFGESEVR
jgi:hypothetical protein